MLNQKIVCRFTLFYESYCNFIEAIYILSLFKSINHDMPELMKSLHNGYKRSDIRANYY